MKIQLCNQNNTTADFENRYNRVYNLVERYEAKKTHTRKDTMKY